MALRITSKTELTWSGEYISEYNVDLSSSRCVHLRTGVTTLSGKFKPKRRLSDKALFIFFSTAELYVSPV